MRFFPAHALKSALLIMLRIPVMGLEWYQRKYGVKPHAPSRIGALWWGYFPVFLVAMLGLANTLYFFRQVSSSERQQVTSAFNGASQDRVLVVSREIESALATILDIATYFEASPQVRRREFRKFVEPAIKRQKGIVALEWIPVVKQQEREEFENNARRSFPLLDQRER